MMTSASSGVVAASSIATGASLAGVTLMVTVATLELAVPSLAW